MPAPAIWAAPASGGTASGDSAAYVSHAGSYWFALSRKATTGITLRYATDPIGTWSTATLPAAPSTYNDPIIASWNAGVQFDGTNYAVVLGYTKTASPVKYRIVHCTDPAGTWTAYEFDATDTYVPDDSGGLIYANGTWVLSGYYSTASPQPAMIGTSSTVNGTYTFYTSASDVGYNTADLTGGGTRFWNITGVAFDGATWVSCAVRNTGTAAIRTSSTLIGGWSAPSSAPSTDFTNAYDLRSHGNGYWTVHGSNDNFHYTDAPAGTWTNLPRTAMGFYYDATEIEYANGYWVATGTDEDPSLSYRAAAIRYAKSATTPDALWRVAQSSFTSVAPSSSNAFGLRSSGSYWVAGMDVNAELRWSRSTSAPSILRQRQSPKRTPSRVRGVDLRQRQTPTIR